MTVRLDGRACRLPMANDRQTRAGLIGTASVIGNRRRPSVESANDPPVLAGVTVGRLRYLTADVGVGAATRRTGVANDRLIRPSESPSARAGVIPCRPLLSNDTSRRRRVLLSNGIHRRRSPLTRPRNHRQTRAGLIGTASAVRHRQSTRPSVESAVNGAGVCR